jgi:hypothetical protein
LYKFDSSYKDRAESVDKDKADFLISVKGDIDLLENSGTGPESF